MNSLDAIVGFVTIAEKMLDCAVVSNNPSSPVALVIRTALIREIALGDQIIAAMRNGATLAACRACYDELLCNHRIVAAGISQLKG